MDFYLDNIESLSDQTIRTYNSSYNKLTEMLGQPIEESQISQNFFYFFDESQSEKIVRKMRIEFRYASE